MNKRFESLAKPAASLALVAGLGSVSLFNSEVASAAKNVHHAKSDCTGLVFNMPKGGPGASVVDVYPVLKGIVAPEEMSGEVVRGNDKGELLANPPGSESSVVDQFYFTYNPNSTATQYATVSAEVAIAGNPRLQVCPDTTLHFNPITNDWGPRATK